MQTAVLSLFSSPQNNLKLFVDGQPIEPSGKASSQNSLAAIAATVLGFNKDSIVDMHASQVAELLVKVLLKSGASQCYWDLL